MLLCETFPVGPFQANCTVLACGDTQEAVVIDPGGGVDHIQDVVARHGLTVTAILHTHGHLDHVSATVEVKELYGCKIWLHEDDLPTYRSWPAQAVLFGLRPGRVAEVDAFLHDGDVIDVPILSSGKVYQGRVRVVGREVLDPVPGGPARCIRLRATFTRDGTPSDVRAEIWLTDDRRRLPARVDAVTDYGRLSSLLTDVERVP